MQFLPLVSTLLLTLLLSPITILAITANTMNSEKPRPAEVSGDDIGSFNIVLYSSGDKAEDLSLICDDNPCDQTSVIKSTSLDQEYFLAGGSQGMTISGASVGLNGGSSDDGGGNGDCDGDEEEGDLRSRQYQ